MTHAIRLGLKDLNHRRLLAALTAGSILLVDNQAVVAFGVNTPLSSAVLVAGKWLLVILYSVVIVRDDPLTGPKAFWRTRPIRLWEWTAGKAIAVGLPIVPPALLSAIWFLMKLQPPLGLAAQLLERTLLGYLIAAGLGAVAAATTETFLGALLRITLVPVGFVLVTALTFVDLSDRFPTEVVNTVAGQALKTGSPQFMSAVAAVGALLGALLLGFELQRPTKLANGLLFSLGIPILVFATFANAPVDLSYPWRPTLPGPHSASTKTVNLAVIPSLTYFSEYSYSFGGIAFRQISAPLRASGNDDSDQLTVQVISCIAHLADGRSRRLEPTLHSFSPLGPNQDSPYLRALNPQRPPEAWSFRRGNSSKGREFPVPMFLTPKTVDPKTLSHANLDLTFVIERNRVEVGVSLPLESGASARAPGEYVHLHSFEFKDGLATVTWDAFAYPLSRSEGSSNFPSSAGVLLWNPGRNEYSTNPERTATQDIAVGTVHGLRYSLQFTAVRANGHPAPHPGLDRDWLAGAHLVEFHHVALRPERVDVSVHDAEVQELGYGAF